MQTPKDNCLNIGRDDISTPALFVHAPRAPRRPNDQYGYQLRFGGDTSNYALIRRVGSVHMGTTVYRDSETNYAELQVNITENGGGGSHIDLRLTANEMQTLACALLDAAHHLRTVPAAPFVAPVKADAEAVPA
jgi:hypothetical protein